MPKENVNVYLPGDLKQRAQEAADIDRRRLSDWIRNLVIDELERRQEKTGQ